MPAQNTAPERRRLEPDVRAPIGASVVGRRYGVGALIDRHGACSGGWDSQAIGSLDFRGRLFDRRCTGSQYVSPLFDGSGRVLVPVCGQAELVGREPTRAASMSTSTEVENPLAFSLANSHS